MHKDTHIIVYSSNFASENNFNADYSLLNNLTMYIKTKLLGNLQTQNKNTLYA